MAADPRMSQLLPTIRCGTCSHDVPYRDLGTHLCVEAPPMPGLPFQLSTKLSNIIKEKETIKYHLPSSPNDEIQSPVSFRSDGYDSGYNSRVPSSSGFAEGSHNDFERWRRLSGSAPRSSMAVASSGFLEKYGRLGGKTPEEEDEDYGEDVYEEDGYRPALRSREDLDARLDSAVPVTTLGGQDDSPDRGKVGPHYERSTTRSRDENTEGQYSRQGAQTQASDPESDDETASRYSDRSTSRSEAYDSNAVYGGREKVISESPDSYNDDTRSHSQSIRSGGQLFAETNEDDVRHVSPPYRGRSTRSSNASSSAQEYIERKYGIAPPTGKEGKPLPLPKPDTSKPKDPAVTKSGSAPLKFIRNQFSPTSPTDDLSNAVKSLGISSKQAVLVKPRDDGTIKERTKCGSCKRHIFASETSLEAIGLAFHVSCFRCDQCEVPIDEKTNFMHVHGKVLCEKICGPAVVDAGAADNKNLLTIDTTRKVQKTTEVKKDQLDCHDCNKPITGRPVYAMRKPYHEGHLRCNHCRSPIQPSVGHVEHVGNVYCPADFARIFLPKCHTCKKPIESEAVCALDHKWHPECFGCQVCHNSFPDKTFYVLDKNPLCRLHYHEQNNSLCHTCNEPIEGACAQIQPEGRSGKQIDRYHPPCFACTECRRPLNDMYYNYGGQPYCERHIMDIQRKKNIRVERRRTVFSILPPGY